MLTHERLLEILTYDKQTGNFVWNNGPFKGKISGSIRDDGYVRLKIDNKNYYAHRLAWLYCYGEFPKQMIDHINGIRNDNRIENLRDVSAKVNSQNYRKCPAKNSTGLLGAQRSGKRWKTRIRIGDKQIHIGCYNTAEEAHQAYVNIKRQVHEGNTL